MSQIEKDEPIGRLITSQACVEEGAAWLAAQEPRFAFALTLTVELPTRLRADGFEALLQAIVSQQVSVASARAIWARLEAASMTSAPAVSGENVESLRALGLSRQKATYALALAQANIDFNGLRVLPNPDVIKTLVAVKGIGVWTAEIYAMFSLGRADVFAPGDLALQEGARLLFELPERPKEKALRQMCEAWSPWRSVAARILWAYYHVIKDRDGIV